MAEHITRYDKMPIPPIDAHTQYFEAGVMRIGVEYRVLTDEVVEAIRQSLEGAAGSETGKLEDLDDSGVSLHIYGPGPEGEREYLRFDCFREDPHYHYVGWAHQSNEVLHIDPIANGDPLTWALERIRSRLAPMLVRAGAPEVAAQVDPVARDAVMPAITEAAFRARYRGVVDSES